MAEKEIIHVHCAKESEWGELHEYMKNQTATLERIERKQARILERIFGNGNEGLVTRAALNKQAIKRAWWWLGGLSVAILSIVVGIVGVFLKGGLK